VNTSSAPEWNNIANRPNITAPLASREADKWFTSDDGVPRLLHKRNSATAFGSRGDFEWYGDTNNTTPAMKVNSTGQLQVRDDGNTLQRVATRDWATNTFQPKGSTSTSAGGITKSSNTTLDSDVGIRFSRNWTGYPDNKTDGAEISNDTTGHKTLMIVGNMSAGQGRKVSVWDRLDVNGALVVNGNFCIGGTCLNEDALKKLINNTNTNSLYDFTSHTFTSGGSTGRFGPTLDLIKRAYASTSWASNTQFLSMPSQGIQLWTVPRTGTYKITCGGARGGRITVRNLSSGNGALTVGSFSLSRGEKLKILVGQPGGEYQYTGGGGGGSFVTKENNDPLIVAGGGGGSGNDSGNGRNASLNTDGTTGTPGYAAGRNGYGSTDDRNNGWGQSGAGFYSDGNGRGQYSWNLGEVAKGFINGGIGAQETHHTTGSCVGAPGGFGGGASGACNGGGGGGGYSGGGAGGGGGGSYNAGANQNNSNYNLNGSGSGYVIIEYLF
jgi:hypothetical protein